LVVLLRRETKLLEIAGALDTSGSIANLLHRRHHQADQHCDNGQDDQQLDQGKTATKDGSHGGSSGSGIVVFSRNCCAGRAANGEDDFAGSLVIDEQVQLVTERTGLADFQLTSDFAGAGRQFGQADGGALRTEAAIVPSAFDQAENRHRSAGVVVQADDHLALLTGHTVRNIDDGGLDFQGQSGRRSEIGVTGPGEQADAGQEEETC